MTDQQPLVGVLIGPDESPDIRTDQDSPPRGTREGENTYCAVLILSVSLSGAKNTGDVSTQSTNSIHVRRVSIVDRVSE